MNRGIGEKDRSQILRMAGNIACGLVTGINPYESDDKLENKIAEVSARIAIKTMKDVDAAIEVSK